MNAQGNDKCRVFETLLKDITEEKAIREVVNVYTSDNVCTNAINIVKKGWKQHWFSFIGDKPWLVIELKNSKASISSYEITTYSGDPQYAHLKSWILEGATTFDPQSNNGDFTVIDEQKNSNSLNSPSASAEFQLQECTPPYKYFRLRMTGENHAGGEFLVIRGIELLGSIVA